LPDVGAAGGAGWVDVGPRNRSGNLVSMTQGFGNQGPLQTWRGTLWLGLKHLKSVIEE
jgi:hypothetical protein